MDILYLTPTHDVSGYCACTPAQQACPTKCSSGCNYASDGSSSCPAVAVVSSPTATTQLNTSYNSDSIQNVLANPPDVGMEFTTTSGLNYKYTDNVACNDMNDNAGGGFTSTASLGDVMAACFTLNDTTPGACLGIEPVKYSSTYSAWEVCTSFIDNQGTGVYSYDSVV